jgi:hypothetical protein
MIVNVLCFDAAGNLVDTEQRVFLKAGNLDLNPPLTWKTYGDSYTING